MNKIFSFLYVICVFLLCSKTLSLKEKTLSSLNNGIALEESPLDQLSSGKVTAIKIDDNSDQVVDVTKLLQIHNNIAATSLGVVALQIFKEEDPKNTVLECLIWKVTGIEKYLSTFDAAEQTSANDIVKALKDFIDSHFEKSDIINITNRISSSHKQTGIENGPSYENYEQGTCLCIEQALHVIKDSQFKNDLNSFKNAHFSQDMVNEAESILSKLKGGDFVEEEEVKPHQRPVVLLQKTLLDPLSGAGQTEEAPQVIGAGFKADN